MSKKFWSLFMFSFIMLSGCSLLSDTDPEFSREKYDDWYEQEQYELALEEVNQRLEKYPEDPLLHNEKGYVLNLMGQHEEALQPLDQAIELDDQMDSAFNNKALSLNELGDYEQAIVAAQKAIDISDKEPEQFINMGNAHSLLERDEKALEYYNKALEIDDSAPNALYGKGISLYFLAEYEKGIPYLERYIKAYPEDIDGLWYLVYSHDLLEEYSDTIPYLDKIIELESEQPLDALDYKGLMLTYAGNFKEAEEVYNNIIEQYPNEALGYYGKSIALVQQGEVDQGLEELDKSIELNDTFKDTAYNDPLFSPIYEDETFIELTEY
ncbi:TPR repeat-containing protein [Gracilibacillus orientalis]|uniref:TPR repeat-containing protein n=1 Tax=Gracilibacillus orientalis TaxID=334253 RepID=A0A1I4IYF0_9BACI|nr:tetratricopeptide repeat protein [Gracilibacillus orientalis]SFL59047.1 TPR repeat-containing protein [Gracilibacillus orientalis]